MMNYLSKRYRLLITCLCLITLSSIGIAQEDPLPQLLERATTFVQQSNYDKALSIYTFYLQFQPHHIEALSQRAVTYASMGHFNEAYEDIDRAFESAGFSAIDQAVVHNNRAQIYFLARENVLALSDFNRAIELNPTDANYWLNRGILHQIMNNWDLAIADYEQYLTLNPDDAEAYLSIARVYLAQENYTKAVYKLDSAIDLTPGDAELYIFRGSVNLLAERFAFAATDYADWLRLINTEDITGDPITEETDQRVIGMSYGKTYRIPFNAESGDRFGVSATSQFVDSLVILIDPDGNPIMANDDGGQGLNSFILDFTLPMDGSYTLLIGHARGGWDGEIEVTTQIVPAKDI